jgi:hypothetical protein
MTLRFGVLGRLEVWSDGDTVPVPRCEAPSAVGLPPGFHAGEPQPVERIVDARWPDGGRAVPRQWPLGRPAITERPRRTSRGNPIE